MAKQHCSQLCKILSIIDFEGHLSFLLNKSLVCDKILRLHTAKVQGRQSQISLILRHF